MTVRPLARLKAVDPGSCPSMGPPPGAGSTALFPKEDTVTLPQSIEEDRVVELARPASPTSVAEAFAGLQTELQKTITGMRPDDFSLEVDCERDRLRIRFRAYRHREQSR
jgi:hypothetical protein